MRTSPALITFTHFIPLCDIFLYNDMQRHSDLNLSTIVYIQICFYCAQHDDDYVWSKHVADFLNNTKLCFDYIYYTFFDF